jgi:presenilin-like A22 family membrane protease
MQNTYFLTMLFSIFHITLSAVFIYSVQRSVAAQFIVLEKREIFITPQKTFLLT